MRMYYPRRIFIKQIGAALGYLGLSRKLSFGQTDDEIVYPRVENNPTVISTWKHGLAANEVAWKLLEKNADALDAVEKGVNVSENDPKVMSVGYGGLPDEEGHVTLDACIMDKDGNAGAVAFLEGYQNAISVARKVMENTRHIMLVGEGAAAFAEKMGFRKQNLLTEKAKDKWLLWKESQDAKSKQLQMHDTIGMLTLDSAGDLAGACTTSGLAWKIHGRVGDSPIIGAGLYVDNSVGGAASTGVGEECIKVCGSFLVVEMMRRGAEPVEACFEAVRRIHRRHKKRPDFQVAFIALNRRGKVGAASLIKGFSYSVMKAGENRLIEAEYLVK